MAEGGSSTEDRKCVVCVEKIDGVERLDAVGPCDHPGVCSLCYLRLRQLMKEDTCVLCKTVMDRVMVCTEENIRPFEEFQIWGDNAGPEYDWDDKSRMFLPRVYNRTYARPLQEHRCGAENCPKPKSNNLFALEKHLREQHRLNLCKVCLKHRKVFLMEQVRYTNLELQQHIVSGDPKLGQAGHPRCEFCKTRFYDAAQLHDHLVKDHYSCHICERQGILHKYYRDYTDLERHFRSGHFLCEEEECLQKKFVVFDSEIDLAGHTLQMHPNRPVKRQIQVNFKVKRSNWDGTGDEQKEEEEKKQDDEVHEWTYEGEIGEQTQPPEVLAARREAARRAAREGGMLGVPAPAPAPSQPADDFPTLSGGGGGGGRGGGGSGGRGGSRPTTGWASLANNSRPRSEDFPALAGRGGGGGGGGTSFRSAVEAYPTRAQEIAMSGSGDGGWCFDYPMPPSEQTGGGGRGGGGRGGGGGGGGSGGRGRVAGIGNMKLKVDKKAAKRNKQKAAAAALRKEAEAQAAEQAAVALAVEESQSQSHPQEKKAGGGANAATPGNSSSASPPPSARSPSPPAPVEDFPLAPGMRAPVSDEAAVHAGSVAASNGPTLAESIAARQQQQQQGPAGAAAAAAGGGPPSVVMELKELLGEEAFSEVKEISADYRSGWVMPGEYLKAMEERLPADRFGELFEGLIGTLPDEEKRREMQVLLAASRSVKAKAAAKKKNKQKALAATDAPSASATAPSNGTAAAAGSTSAATPTPAAAAPPQQESWPGIGESTGNGAGTGNKQKFRGKAGKSNGGAANGSAGGAKVKAGGGGSKSSPTATAKKPSPGSAATWLKAMGTKTGGTRPGGTGISIVRPSARGGSSNTSGSSGFASNIAAAAGGYSGSRLQCNPGVSARSDLPPPGVPLRRRDEEEAAGIGQAGASWATQGGSGFRAAGKGASAGVKVSRDDFPGLPSGSGGAAALKANRADFPSLPAEGAGMEGLGGAAGAFKVKPRAKSPAPPSQQRAPTQDDFPGLPMPAPPAPGLERVDWGGGGGSHRGAGGGGGAVMSGGGGGAAGGGKGAKKKNKQKAEKDALKGMAFGFR